MNLRYPIINTGFSGISNYTWSKSNRLFILKLEETISVNLIKKQHLYLSKKNENLLMVHLLEQQKQCVFVCLDFVRYVCTIRLRKARCARCVALHSTINKSNSI